VKAEWAFKVYDYNEDEKIDGEDIKRVVMDIIGRNRSVQGFLLRNGIELFFLLLKYLVGLAIKQYL
jgi:hypothetical protein